MSQEQRKVGRGNALTNKMRSSRKDRMDCAQPAYLEGQILNFQINLVTSFLGHIRDRCLNGQMSIGDVGRAISSMNLMLDLLAGFINGGKKKSAKKNGTD